MVKTNRYNPSNKKFKDHFQKLAKTKTKKGHLNESGERDSEDTLVTTGVLIRIEKAKVNTNGWEVEVGSGDSKKTYKCNNITGTTTIPEYTESKTYYVMKNKVEVDLSIDNISKIYSITNIHGADSCFNIKDKKIEITSVPATKTQTSAKLTLSENGMELKSNNINMTGESTFENKVEVKDNMSVYKNLVIQGSLEAPEITNLQKENSQLKNEIKEINKKLNLLLEN